MRFEQPPGSTPIDLDEAAGLIPGLSLQSELNEFEADNIFRALLWARRRRLVPTTPDSLRLLHRRMFDRTWRWAGEFRLTQKSIGVEAFRIPSELRILCDDLAYWLANGTYPPDELLARFHHRLVYIHPFANGNGRHARLAADLLAVSQNWPPPTWGSADLNRTGNSREAYIAALRAADAHDLGPLVVFLRS